MGTKHTGGEGITDYQPVPLSPNTRAAVLDHLTQVAGLTEDQKQEFCSRIEQAIGCYEAQARLGAVQTPASIRRGLENLQSRVVDLLDQLNNLPESVRRLVRANGGQPDDLNHLLHVFQPAVQTARRDAKGITQCDPARTLLAIDVGKAMQDELDITPTTSSGALLDDVLTAVLWEATGMEPTETRALRNQAVQALKEAGRGASG